MAQETDVDRLYREGIAAVRAGDKETGREKLLQVIERDQYHEQAWLWLSATVADREEQIICLENVLTINPNNEAARRGLQKLGATMPEQPSPFAPPAQKEKRSSLLSAVDAKNESLSRVPAARPREGSHRQAAPSPLKPEDDWRRDLATSSSGTAFAIPSDEPPPPRGILDLFDAWFAALIFNIRNAYTAELPVASFGRALLSLMFAGALAGIAAVLNFLLTLAVEGITVAQYFSEVLEPLAEAGISTPTSVAGFSTLFFSLYVIASIIVTVFDGFIVAVGADWAAGWLGGRGEFVDALHTLSIATVARQAVALIILLLAPFLPGLILLILILILSVYSTALRSMAIAATYPELNVLQGFLALVLGRIAISFALGCLASFLAALVMFI